MVGIDHDRIALSIINTGRHTIICALIAIVDFPGIKHEIRDSYNIANHPNMSKIYLKSYNIIYWFI